jgi:hypothetical protein
MPEKRLDLGDGELPHDIGRRFLWTLNRMVPRDRSGVGGLVWILAVLPVPKSEATA